MNSSIYNYDISLNIDKRRYEGIFYTPLPFAKLSIEYIAKHLGKNWYKEYKIWDMACGTGNLEYYIPDYSNVYMSTINNEEINLIKQNNLFPNATIFQYDYLNDDIHLLEKDLLNDSLNWKLPRKLREDLANKKNKWVIFINPPYGEAGSSINNGINKKEISKTKLSILMKHNKINTNELYIQFLYRILNEIPNLYLGIFAKLNYLLSSKHEAFRNNIFKMSFIDGFIFPSKSFKDIKGKFPISFILFKKGKLQNMFDLDIYDTNINKIGKKTIRIIPNNKMLTKWIKKPKNTITYPPVTSAIKIKKDGNIQLDKLSKNAIGFVVNEPNDIAHAERQTIIFTLPYTSNKGSSIEPDMLNKIFIIFAVRKAIKHTWINDKDQFMIPSKTPSQNFINDSMIFTLFNTSNHTSSMKDIEYKGEIYQVRNQFFPFLIKDLIMWEINDDLIKEQLKNAEDTIIAKKINNSTLTSEAQKVLNLGKEIYKLFFKNLNKIDKEKYKIAYWDVGWYQIRHSLNDKGIGKNLFNEFKENYNILKEKIRNYIVEYEIIIPPLIYE